MMRWVFFLPILIPIGIGVMYLWVYLMVFRTYSVPVPGNLRAFDPISSFGEVQKFAGEGLRFKSLEADYVSSNGTLDFGVDYSPAPHVTYTFLQSTDVKHAAPVGAGGSRTGKWMREIEINLGKKGRYSEVSSAADKGIDGDFRSRGMDKDEGYPQADEGEPSVPPPTCSFADLWKVAIQKGAPKDAVAEIYYDVNGYEFSISTADVDLRFNSKCQLTDNGYDHVDPLEPIEPQ